MKVRKLSTGNYFGWLRGFYFFIYKRPHGKWCAIIGHHGEWISREGYHGTYLSTISKARQWVSNKIRSNEFDD
jgi:hypothetical protein